MNKRTCAVSYLLLILLVLPILCSVHAQTYSSGVSMGDTFTYSNTMTWNSTLPGDIAPAYLTDLNQSTLKVTVQQVSGSTVLLQEAWVYKNGTQDVSTEADKVDDGATSSVLAYAANLTAGGPLFPAATDLPFVINETVFRSYAGNNFRETNHIMVNNTGATGEAYSLMNLYFDKQTGILVEYYLTTVYTATPDQQTTQHLLLTDSSVWKISDVPFPTSDSSPVVNPTATPTLPSPSTSTSPNSGGGLPMGLILTIVVVAVVVVVAGYFIFRKGTSKLPEGIEDAK